MMTHRSIAALSIALLLSPACIVVPVRVPELARTPAGANQHLDFSFLRAGVTTRGEVTKNLGAIDTFENENLFWGRWQSSKWYVVAGTINAGGGDRVWGVHNILIQFTPENLVREWVIVDNKDLDRRLDSLVGQNAPALTVPVSFYARLQYQEGFGELTLKKDTLAYNAAGTDLVTPRANIEKLTSADLVDSKYSSPGFTSDTRLEFHAKLHLHVPAEIHYVRKNKTRTFRTKVINVVLEPRDYLLVRRYFLQTMRSSP